MSMPPSWLSGVGGALVTILGALVAARTGTAQRLLALAQVGQTKTATVSTRLDALGLAMKRIDEMAQQVDDLTKRVERLEEFQRNVHESAPRIGVSVTERGVLFVEPGAIILAVDDDPDICAYIKLALEEQNYQVLTACTVADALALIAAQMVAVAILDLYLGRETCMPIVEALRAAVTPKPPQVIIYTGAMDSAAMALVKQIDPMATLRKVRSDIRDLETVVKTAIAKREAAA